MAGALQSSLRSLSLSSEIYWPVIAAMDFGSSSSGYAFAFQDKKSDSINSSAIVLNKWQIGSASSYTDKAPTTVLLQPDKTFDSFGYRAEDKYADLCDAKKHKGWWYFQTFKMTLYATKNLSRDVIIKDEEDKPMPAIEVFSIVIAHLKDSILHDVRIQNNDVTDDDILYVLTVPAIWSDAAKQFMREAATSPKVGIKNEQLKLVLEPEAASVYCRQTLSTATRLSDGSLQLTSLPVGHRYIIADLGGGTIDMATHEVIEGGKLHEIDVARGDDLGGQQFNKNFMQFLVELIGKDVFDQWKYKEKGDYLALLRTIEGLKWKVATTTDDVLLKVDYSLLDIFEEWTDKSLKGVIGQSRFRDSVEVVGKGKLSIKYSFVRGFLEFILIGIDEHIRRITLATQNIETIFFVGGLSKVLLVHQFVQGKIPQYRLIVPEDPGMAVLKGAVLLGKHSEIIAGRIARYSYGINTSIAFVEGKHDTKYKYVKDDKVMCKHIYLQLIQKGQILKYGDTFTETLSLKAEQQRTKQLERSIYLFKSTIASPTYCTDIGCTLLGGIKLEPPEKGWADETKGTVKIVVGDAEFKFLNKILEKEYEIKVDFLSQ